MIILLASSYFTTLLFLTKLFHKDKLFREIILFTTLSFSLILTIITEILSLYEILNFQFLVILWTIYSTVGLFLFLNNKSFYINYRNDLFRKLQSTISNLKRSEVLLLLFSIIFFIGILIQGLIYPPNNGDSMVYHMARISHWINNNSVSHFPTSIYTQLFQPPLAEYFITHTIILQKSDIFANSIQLFFLINTIVVLSLIGKNLGFNKNIQIFLIVIVITTPEILLQGSSTQNDIIVSFFLICSVYILLTLLESVSLGKCLFIGIATGLAFLTKGTAYIYMFPTLLILVILLIQQYFKNKKIRTLYFGLLTILVAFFINSGHYYRNYSLIKNILGIHSEMGSSYENNSFSIYSIGSNVIKNIGLHLGPYPFSRLAQDFIHYIHDQLEIDINDHQAHQHISTLYNITNRPNHEDYAPNIIQMLLIIFSFGMIIILLLRNNQIKNKSLMTIAIISSSQFLLFCIYLKWQFFHSRLHTPVFFLFAIIIAYMFKKISNNSRLIIIYVTVIYATLILIFNASRPFITVWPLTSQINIFNSKELKYFSNNKSYYHEYVSIKSEIKNSNNKNIGLSVKPNFWEYPLFNDFSNERLKPHHLLIYNQFPGFLYQLKSKMDVEYIISSYLKDYIPYNGFKYRRLEIGNQYIFLYKKE